MSHWIPSCVHPLTQTSSWKAKEASLYLLNQLLADFHDVDQTISPEIANGYTEFIKYAMHQGQFTTQNPPSQSAPQPSCDSCSMGIKS